MLKLIIQLFFWLRSRQKDDIVLWKYIKTLQNRLNLDHLLWFLFPYIVVSN